MYKWKVNFVINLKLKQEEYIDITKLITILETIIIEYKVYLSSRIHDDADDDSNYYYYYGMSYSLLLF